MSLGLEVVSGQESSSPDMLIASEHCPEEATEGTPWLVLDTQVTQAASSPRTPASSGASPRGAAGGGQGDRDMWYAEFFGFLSLVGLDRGLVRQLT